MTVDQLLSELQRTSNRFGGDVTVVIYNNGDFIVEDAWYDRVANCFAIQVVPAPEELDKVKREEVE